MGNWKRNKRKKHTEHFEINVELLMDKVKIKICKFETGGYHRVSLSTLKIDLLRTGSGTNKLYGLIHHQFLTMRSNIDEKYNIGFQSVGTNFARNNFFFLFTVKFHVKHLENISQN